jgi:hypothetical protein
MRDMLFSVSLTSPSNVWAVGDQEGSNGIFETLVEHFDGTHWSVVPARNPGNAGNHFYGVAATGTNDVWAVGQQLNDNGVDTELVEHYDGHHWSVVPAPAHPHDTSTALFAVSARSDDVIASGQSENPVLGAHALVDSISPHAVTVANLPKVGSNWTTLWGATHTDTSAYVAGTFLDTKNGNNEVVVLRRDAQGWHLVPAPNPGSGSNILGGIGAVGDTVWTVGVFDNGGSNLTLTERHLPH